MFRKSSRLRCRRKRESLVEGEQKPRWTRCMVEGRCENLEGFGEDKRVGALKALKIQLRRDGNL